MHVKLAVGEKRASSSSVYIGLRTTVALSLSDQLFTCSSGGFSRFRYQGFYWSVYDRISLLATEVPTKVLISIQIVCVLSNELGFKCNEVDYFA